ncbi:YiiX/YebB-like N1pC/P60 family cysteine hydrolase [Francisellaceae bacterium]|nr:YiiX/YebB-like N1pC/P60 family cysteine hydrolase [Francisellaceae bacterium]
MKLLRLLASFLILFSLSTTLFAFTLKPGDLLFQDLECGPLCNAIFTVTHGYHNTDVSHVAMVVSIKPKVLIIEAINKDVHLIPLKKFLARSLDKDKKPRVMVGRLTQPYRHLIPQAIKDAKKWIGKPYNNDYTSNNHDEEFYCSQLIYDAFENANEGKPIFTQDKMNFHDFKTHHTFPSWKAYFKSIKKDVPQGKLGTNPGKISRSPHLKIIHFYGKLQKNTLSQELQK